MISLIYKINIFIVNYKTFFKYYNLYASLINFFNVISINI